MTQTLCKKYKRGGVTLFHIDIQHHYIHKLVKPEAITLKKVSSVENSADLFTKLLSWDHHHAFLPVPYPHPQVPGGTDLFCSLFCSLIL